MQTNKLLALGLLLGLGTGSAWAVPQPAARFGDDLPAGTAFKGGAPAVDAFGDPGDFPAAVLAGGDYLVAMQADISEDNAGNGLVDTDPDDGGWDWSTNTFSHSASASATNLYGVTALGLLSAWNVQPKATYFTAMTDAADAIVAAGPTVIRTASDISFLLGYAALPGVASPSTYQAAAEAIWLNRKSVNGGGTATGFAIYLRDVRGVTQNYPNGIVAWDLGAYAVAVQALHVAYPGLGYDVEADAIAEVMYQDAFQANPGRFQPFAPAWQQPYDPADRRTWWYTLGVTGLVDAFGATGSHPEALAPLQTLLLACQYPDGAFSGSYGANEEDNDRSWQATGYAAASLGRHLSGVEDETNAAAWWLAATQDASGAFVYSNGYHYPEIGGECVAGMSFGELAYRVHQSPLYDHVAVLDGAPRVDRVTTSYSLSAGTELFRSITVFVQYDPAVLRPAAITRTWSPEPGNDTFQHNLLQNPNGMLEITHAILGPTSGVSGAVPSLFTITWDGLLEDVNPGTTVHIAQVVMRDPVNQDIFAAGGTDVEIEVDGSAPTLQVTYPLITCIKDDFEVTLDADDNVNLDRIEYEFNGDGSWLPAVPAGYPVDSFFDVFLVEIGDLDEGENTVVFRTWDDVGHPGLSTVWTFHVDTEAPQPATGLSAAPRDHSIHLSWTAGTELDGYTLYRAKRGAAYPYPGGRPGLSTWPDDYTQIDVLGPAVTVYDDDDFPVDDYDTRGIYDYVLVATDCVNSPAASAPASATNYFLGDWADINSYSEPYDGSVCIYDLNHLGGQYGNLSSALNNEMDVAPTHNMGRFGLPGPDGRLNFEDLIILAMNYRACGSSPLLQIRRGESANRLADASTLRLEGAGTLRQLLLDGSLLGLTATLETEATLLSATSSQGTALFYRTENGWTVDVVGLDELLGSDTVVELRFDRELPVTLASAQGRDEENTVRPLEGLTDGQPLTPAVFELAQNHPNPFNPATTLRYSLATAGSVRLEVYNSLGQQVAVLVDGFREVGVHELRFDGSALASGVYLVRLQAEGFTAQRKMMLMK